MSANGRLGADAQQARAAASKALAIGDAIAEVRASMTESDTMNVVQRAPKELRFRLNALLHASRHMVDAIEDYKKAVGR